MKKSKKETIESYFNKTGTDLINSSTHINSNISNSVQSVVASFIDLRSHTLEIKLLIMHTTKAKALQEIKRKLKLLEKTYNELLILDGKRGGIDITSNDCSSKVPKSAGVKKSLLKTYYAFSVLRYKTDKSLEERLYTLGKLYNG